MLFLYWLRDVKTGKNKNFITESFYDTGELITIKGVVYEVLDYAVEGVVNCEDLAEVW